MLCVAAPRRLQHVLLHAKREALAGRLASAYRALDKVPPAARCRGFHCLHAFAPPEQLVHGALGAALGVFGQMPLACMPCRAADGPHPCQRRLHAACIWLACTDGRLPRT